MPKVMARINGAWVELTTPVPVAPVFPEEVVKSVTAPSDPATDLWVDITDPLNPVLMMKDGAGVWKSVGGGAPEINRGETAPTDPAAQIWIDVSNDFGYYQLKVRDFAGTGWKESDVVYVSTATQPPAGRLPAMWWHETAKNLSVRDTAGAWWQVGGAQTVDNAMGTGYPVIANDVGKLKRITDAGTTVTLPGDVATVGQRIDFVCIAGPATFALGAGATWDVPPTPSAAARAVGSFVSAIKMTATAWALTGDLA